MFEQKMLDTLDIAVDIRDTATGAQFVEIVQRFASATAVNPLRIDGTMAELTHLIKSIEDRILEDFVEMALEDLEEIACDVLNKEK